MTDDPDWDPPAVRPDLRDWLTGTKPTLTELLAGAKRVTGVIAFGPEATQAAAPIHISPVLRLTAIPRSSSPTSCTFTKGRKIERRLNSGGSTLSRVYSAKPKRPK